MSSPAKIGNKEYDLSSPPQRQMYWTLTASNLLKGRKIITVRYMTRKEANERGWDEQPVVIVLDNGIMLYPSRDDEGNGAGVLFTSDETVSRLPAL